MTDKSYKGYDIILFDLDGTLTDSGEGIINSVKYALRTNGDDIPDESVLLKFIGPPLWESFETFCGFSHEKACGLVELYREYYREKGLFENAVYDGVEKMLSELKAQGKRLAVATSKPEVFSVRILEHFGLAEYFENITGATLDGTRIEKADVIACALECCGADKDSRVLMVGDRKHDILGAHKNNIPCAAVLYGYGTREEFEEYGADYIVKEPSEIAALAAQEEGKR